MRITLINPPQYTKYPQPPIGLALLGAWYEKQGYEVTIVDKNVGQELNLLSVVNANILGITSMTTTFNYVKPLLGISLGIDIIGGVHATIFADQLKEKYPFLGINKGEFEPLKDINDWGFLAYHLLPIDRYKPHPPHGKYGKWLPLLSSKGCPYQCVYCSKAVFGNTYQYMIAERVVEEIKYMQKRFGVKEITFYDDVFTLSKARTQYLCELLIKEKLGIHWSCETRVNLVDKPLLKLMKKAGCYSIFYGLESGNQSILDSICKKTTVEQNEYAVKIAHEVGLETVGYFMIGSPNETHQTIKDTIDFAKKLPLDYAQFAITTPLPGSELYEIWKKTYGKEVDWADFRYDGSKNSPVFETENLTRANLEFYRSKAYREFYIRPDYMWNKLIGLRNFNDFKVLFDGINMLVSRS